MTTVNTKIDHPSTTYGLAWVPVNAFNLIVGAAFRMEGDASRGYVVTHVLYRHAGTERIGIVCRVIGIYLRPKYNEDSNEGVGKYETFSLDFCDTVQLIGLSVNPDSWDDIDIGQDASN